MQGRIIKIISNDYTVLSNDKEYICKSRGLFRNQNIKPLVGVLKLIDKVNAKWHEKGNEPVGISKNEFAIFALSLINADDIDSQVDKLLDYRDNVSKLPLNERNNYYKEYINENLSDFSNANIMAGIESVTKLIHNNCSVVKGTCPLAKTAL